VVASEFGRWARRSSKNPKRERRVVNNKTSVGAWNGDRIRELRLDLGMTQEDFAFEIGVSDCTINRWENGRNRPNDNNVEALELMQKKLERRRRRIIHTAIVSATVA